MKIYDEIHRFARDYIKDKSQRSTWKKRRIREAYELLTGKKIKISCSTCYIEALLTIVNNTKMAARNYELKKGVLLQAFGHPAKTCTNDTLTDELAEWHLKESPEKIKFFSRYPAKVRTIPPSDIKIVVPKKEEAKVEETEIINPEEPDRSATDPVTEALGSAMEGKQPDLEEEVKPPIKRKPVKRKR